MSNSNERYMEVVVLQYNDDEQELMNKKPEDCELIECKRKINPFRIESYGEAIPKSNFRDDNKVWTKIVMQSGDDFIIGMPMSDFEKRLNIFNKQ